MAKLKKAITPKKVSKKTKEEVKEEVLEETPEETPDDSPETKEVLAGLPKNEEKSNLGSLGGYAVLSIKETEVNGKKFNAVSLSDGTSMLLSDEDLTKQLK